MRPPERDGTGRGEVLNRRACRPVFALAVSLVLCGLSCSPAPTQPNVLLITVDTLRADHLGAYGATEGATPNIDQLAREGALFERASAPMPLTRPTHASMLTGLYPREHGLVNNALSLEDEQRTLAEILRERGYRTGAFVSVSLLSPQGGFAQGFEAFQNPVRPRSRPASSAVEEALAWLETVEADAPFFLWVHLFDPHLPYAPPEPYGASAEAALREALPAVSWSELERVADENGGDVPPEVLRHARILYRGEVGHTDEWVGRLLDGVDRQRSLDETLVLFTADHGECFGNGVYFEHSDCLQEAALRVPLIVRYPPDFESGVRLEGQVSSIDVTPTILHGVGLPQLAVSGRPLQDLARGEERRFVLVQHPMYHDRDVEARSRRHSRIRSVAGDPILPLHVASERVGLVGSGWKYLRDGEGDALYRVDAGRETDEDDAQTRKHLSAELDRLLEAHPLRVADAGEINDELRETLRALGYVVPDDGEER